MRILQINKFHYPKAGADQYYFNLSKLLEANGHEVIHFAMEDEKNVASPYSKYFVSKLEFGKVMFNLTGLKVFGRMLYSFEAKRKMEELIKDTKPEIAHIHNIYHQISPSILGVLKKHKIPVVMTAHDYGLISPNYSLYCHGKIYEGTKVYRFWDCIFRKCVKDSYAASFASAAEMSFHKLFKFFERNINLILVPSKFMADKFIEYKIPKNKLKVLRLFIDAKGLNPRNEQEDYFIYFGRLSEEKGIEYLIEALKLAPEAKLKIVGTGPLEEQLKVLAKNFLVADRVEFVGYKKGKDLWDLVGKSLTVVIPSVWYENAPMSILESYALGRPVLGSKIGGIPELVESEETGLLFPPGNHEDLAVVLQWSIKNKKKLDMMGDRARKKIETDFSPDEHYKKIIKIYEKLLAL